MISEVTHRKFDNKHVVWSHIPCSRLGLKPYSEEHVAHLWTITGVFETKTEAILFAKDFHVRA